MTTDKREELSMEQDVPSADFDEAWDSRDYLLDDCWNCGGEGYVANCQDEIACMYPEDGCDLCMQRCEYCNPAPKVSP